MLSGSRPVDWLSERRDLEAVLARQSMVLISRIQQGSGSNTELII